MTTTQPDREIIITRTVNAPRQTVWKAFTDPELLKHWWGPDGFTITTHAFSFTKGGEWRFMMHGPDGRDYPNVVIFTDFREPEFISHDHSDDKGTIHFQATITFEEHTPSPAAAGYGGVQTLVTMKSVFPSKEARDFVVKEHGAIEGGKQTLGRLAKYLEKA